MANSAVVGILRVLLSADTAEFQSAMQAASKTADAWTKDLRSIGAQAQSVGKTLTAALTLPLVGIAGASVKAAIGFESSFSNVAKTVDGVSDKAGKLTKAGEVLAGTFRQMAKEIPATTDELNSIAALGGQMGVPIDQLEKFTRNVAALGVAVDGISTEEAASGLAAIGNATGTGTTQIAEMASALVHLGNNSNATEADILEFTKRLVGAGNSAGMTVPEIMAIGTAMANVGINAEAGGTAMSTVIAKIGKAVSTGNESLQEFARVAGKSAEDFAAIWKRSPIEAMDLFVKGLATMRERGVDLNLTMGELGTEGIRVADTLKRLSGAGNGISTALKFANEGFAAGNKHLEEAQKKYATTEKQLTLLWNRITDIGITIGNALLPGIQAAIRVFDALLPAVDQVAKMFGAMPGWMQLVVVGLGGIVAAAGPVIYVFGTLARSAADLTAVFGKKGLATRALAGDYDILTTASGKLGTSLGLLGKAAGVAAAAFVGWQIGRLIADFFELDRKIADTIIGLDNLKRARQLAAAGKGDEAEAEVQSKLIELERKRTQAIQERNLAGAKLIEQQIENLKHDQTRLAIQDTINAAIKRGADAHITYAQAVKFNEEWLKKQQTAQQAVTTATTAGAAATGAAGKSVSELQKLTAQYAADLKKIGTAGFREIVKAHEAFGESVSDLAKSYGVAESSIDHYIAGQRKSAQATKDAAKEVKDADAVLKEFAKTTGDLEQRMDQLDAVISRGLGSVSDEARRLVEKWEKQTEEGAKRAAESQDAANKRFLDQATALQRGLLELDEDSLEKRQALIRLDFEARRAALDKHSAFYEEQLALLNAQEAKALGESAAQWHQTVRDKFVGAVSELGQAFVDLAQVSDGTFGGIAKAIGEMVNAMQVAAIAGGQLRDLFSTITIGEDGQTSTAFSLDKFTLGGAGGWDRLLANYQQAIGAAVSAVGAMASATDPSHRTTGQTVASGAATGASLGSQILPGWGTAIGAGVGALVGWWRGAHATWKKVAKDIGQDIGVDISDGLAQQIADLSKTLEGGTKAQRRKWAELLSLDAIIQEAGGLKSDTIQKYERQASGLFEAIRRGGTLGAQATAQLNTLVGQFADYAETAGGLWDDTFKSLIRKSRELGISLESVNKAIDAQVDKLAGGLSAMAGGAFSGTDKALANLGLSPEDLSAALSGDAAALDRLDLDPAKLDEIRQIADDAQGAFDRLSRSALAAFNTMIANGRSAFDAISALGPTIDILIQRHDQLGLSGGAAYEQLARFRTLTKENEALVASVGGLNDTLVALANLGGLNVDVLADLEAQGKASFDQLTAAGFTELEALQQMVPFLENVIKAHRDLGVPIDENTQKLIDLADANNLLSDEAMSMTDILMEGFGALITAVGGELPEAFKKFKKAGQDAAAGVTDAVNDIPRDVHIDVHENWKRNGGIYDDMAPEEAEPHARGGRIMAFALGGRVPEPAQPLATGGIGRLLQFTPSGTDTVPAMLTPGEGVLNTTAMRRLGPEAFEALNRGVTPGTLGMPTPAPSPSTRAGDTYQVTVHLAVEGSLVQQSDLAAHITDLMTTELRRKGLRLSKFQDAVGL